MKGNSLAVTRFLAGILLAALLLNGDRLALAQSAGPPEPPLSPAEKEEARKARLKLAADGLERLYKLHPEARASVEKAPGYAVFDITAIYAIFFVGQKGAGVMFDNKTSKPTYMQSMRAGTGPGIGKQRVYQVFVFKNKGAMDQFVLAGGTGRRRRRVVQRRQGRQRDLVQSRDRHLPDPGKRHGAAGELGRHNLFRGRAAEIEEVRNLFPN